MKLNRKLVLVLALLMSVAMITTGTLAYLTDRDSDVNVFTVGNVDITLEEDFVQGSELVPGVDIDKVPTITNTGKNDAYVWMTVAVPAGLESSDASDNIVHWNWMAVTDEAYMNNKTQADVDAKIAEGKLPEGTTIEQIRAGQNWDVEGTTPIGTETIDGVTYNVYLMKYNDVLQPGETTLASLHNVYLDPHVDIDPEGNLAWVEDGVATDLGYNINTMGNPKIYVSAYGMQVDGFDSVDEAYEAYGEQWGENGSPEYEDMEKEAADNEALAAAIESGASVINLGEGTFKLPASAAGKKITLIGEGPDTVVECKEAINLSGAELAFANLTVEGIDQNYKGYQHTKSLSFTNCVIDKSLTLYASDVVFDKCTFKLQDRYIWTYGADNVLFDSCTFDNADSRAILVYQDSGDTLCNVTVKDCTFKAAAKGHTGGGDWTAAIEIDTSISPAAVEIINSTVDDNYNGLYRIKNGTCEVTVDGVVQ